MDIKKSIKLNSKLGFSYTLIPSSDGWVLMRSGSFRVIMDSTKNTEEELEQFIKEHREYNALVITRKFGIIANIIILCLCVANLYIHSDLLSYFNLGAIIILLPLLILVNHISLNNRVAYEKVIDEDIEYYGKLMYETETEKKKSTRAKRGRKKSSEVQK